MTFDLQQITLLRALFVGVDIKWGKLASGSFRKPPNGKIRGYEMPERLSLGSQREAGDSMSLGSLETVDSQAQTLIER